jgi:hypothetical protein
MQQKRGAAHWNGMLRNSRSHIAVQHQPLLTGSDVGGRGHNENWSLHNMATELMQTSETSTTTFKDDELEVTVILYWTKRARVKFLEVHDGECTGNLIFILGLEMENIVFSFSKHFVILWKFLKYWNIIAIMVAKTKLTKIIQFFLIMNW